CHLCARSEVPPMFPLAQTVASSTSTGTGTGTGTGTPCPTSRTSGTGPRHDPGQPHPQGAVCKLGQNLAQIDEKNRTVRPHVTVRRLQASANASSDCSQLSCSQTVKFTKGTFARLTKASYIGRRNVDLRRPEGASPDAVTAI